MKFATKATQLVDEIIPEAKNYHKLRVKSYLARAYLSKDNIEESEKLAKQCCDEVIELFNEQPIQLKYQYDLLEILNNKKDCSERNNQILAISEKAVKLCEERFGPQSIFLARPLHSLFLSYV